MATEVPRMLLEIRYYKAAQEYLRRLPLEHFMEATPQATQRKITLASLELVHARRPDIQFFNELLVQYPLPRPKRKKPGQVVPDNMVVIHPEPIQAVGSYDLPFQPVRPFWVLEYVSRSSSRKDYEENMHKYENELRVPYYLLFNPDLQEVSLYRLVGERYGSVHPNADGLCALPELEMAVGLVEGWARFWFRGELLALPGELQRALDEKDRQLTEKDRQLTEKDRQLAEKDRQLTEKDRQAGQVEKRMAAMAEELALLRARLTPQPPPPGGNSG